jgi:hypothetical protein
MTETTPKSAQSSLGKRRKLRSLVITMGSKHQSFISNLFSHPSISPYFEPPIFSEGVPQRDLSSRTILLKHAGQAGILPPEEWEVLKPWLNSSVRKTTTNHMEAEWKDRSGKFVGVSFRTCSACLKSWHAFLSCNSGTESDNKPYQMDSACR